MANLTRGWCADCGHMTLCEPHGPLDELAYDECVRMARVVRLDDEFDDDSFALGAEWGAGWAFALIGMAQAIRDTDRWRRAVDAYVTYGNRPPR